MKGNKRFAFLLVRLAFHVAYCAYYITFGMATRSWWLFTVGVYYVILSTVQFVIILTKKSVRLVTRFTGVMLMVLSLPLAGITALAIIRDRGTVFPKIMMIAIAVYSFTKIILATGKLINTRHRSSEKLLPLRNLSFADACVSIFALQRSMLVSFAGMSERDVRLMNGIVGFAVCVTVFLLGLNLMRKNDFF